MSRNLTLIIVLLFMGSCGMKRIQKGQRVPLKMVQIGTKINANKDDLYAILALDAKYRGDPYTAAKYFHKLYLDTRNPNFAYEAIRDYGAIKAYKKLYSLLEQAGKDHPEDLNLKRYLAAYYIDTKHYKEANQLLKSIPKSSQQDIANADEALRASTLLGLGKTKEALHFFRKRYEKEKSTQNALTLFRLLLSVGKEDEAIALLQNHTDFIGCDEKICINLIALYKERNEVEPIIKLTKKLYQTTHKASYANMLLDLYRYIDDKDRAIAFLEQSHFNDRLLLDLYLNQKMYEKAKALAHRLYNQDHDIHMLAQIQMIEYESAKAKNPKLKKSFLNRIRNEFDKIVKKINDPVYDNFYGYILIDEGLDPDRGIRLVKRALQKRPKSIYFLDSLAWGYYKKKECKKALQTIEPIAKDSKIPEITEHYTKIKECQ